MLEEYLAERRGAKVEIRAAERGEKRRMLELAQRNAELALQHDAVMAERTRARRAGRSRSCARRSTSRRCRAHRVLRHLEHRRTTAWPRWWCSRRPAGESDYRKYGVRGTRRRTTSPPCARPWAALTAPPGQRRATTALRTPTSSSSTAARGSSAPRSRRWRSSTWGISRWPAWPSARSCSSCPDATSRSGCPGTRPSCTSCSACATRPTASPSASIGRRAPSSRRPRCSTRCPGWERSAAARWSPTSATRSASSPPRATSWRRCPACPPKVGRDLYEHLHRVGGARAG